MTKKEEAALQAELAACRNRGRAIKALLIPRPESEALVYLRGAKGPVKGAAIAAALGKARSHVSTDLGRAVKEGKAIRCGVGEFQAVTQ